MAKEFIWLIGSQLPRKGPPLVKGATYKTSDFPLHVVERWVKTKVAKWVGEKSKTKEKK